MSSATRAAAGGAARAAASASRHLLCLVESFVMPGASFGTGNVAAVVMISKQKISLVDDEWMQRVAEQLRQSSTAFVAQDNGFAVRWFTPTREIPLCGHATLASAHLLFQQEPNVKTVELFSPHHSQPLVCVRGAAAGAPLVREHDDADDLITLDLPALPLGQLWSGEELVRPSHHQDTTTKSDESVPAQLVSSLLSTADLPLSARMSVVVSVVSTKPNEYIVRLDKPESVVAMRPDAARLRQLGLRKVTVTAATAVPDNFDIVSRVFLPESPMFEDPFTGSAHCALLPFWSRVYHSEPGDDVKNDSDSSSADHNAKRRFPHFPWLRVHQASKRGGFAYARLVSSTAEHDGNHQKDGDESRGDRVLVCGQARVFVDHAPLHL